MRGSPAQVMQKHRRRNMEDADGPRREAAGEHVTRLDESLELLSALLRRRGRPWRHERRLERCNAPSCGGDSASRTASIKRSHGLQQRRRCCGIEERLVCERHAPIS